ncbi:protein-glutamine gamma-glutamyltransferase E-like [Pseudochaenichthys georgianus]|uniref:protein-glutamine gamma-glutamyltransferase E-like n=1 Tax=Pseudochaenichthys georgianus TaxID=52239 RepID=UPI00146C9E74|nr:protein-glutamine gamma-glutamyltransferase E-like [Pseudochaenichthys georgianus]
MLDCDSLKVSALVTDKERPDNMYLAVDDVVLIDPPISLKVSPPRNGKDVRLKLLLRSESSSVRSLSINISVQAMTYDGFLGANIQTEVKDKILLPGKDLRVRIRVPFSAYHKPMLDCDSLKVSALVTDKERPDNMYLAVDDVVLIDPPISLKVNGSAKVNRATRAEMIFMNPTVTETLTNCTLTLSGSGLMKEEVEFKLPDIKPNNRLRVNFSFVPYKCGKRTLVADFDCSTFRDIKASCTVNVKRSRC